MVAAPAGLHGSARGSLRAVSWSQESIRKARGCYMAAPPSSAVLAPLRGRGAISWPGLKGAHGIPMGCLEEEKSFSPAATFTALLPNEVSRRSLDQLANSTSLHLSFLVFS